MCDVHGTEFVRKKSYIQSLGAYAVVEGFLVVFAGVEGVEDVFFWLRMQRMWGE